MCWRLSENVLDMYTLDALEDKKPDESAAHEESDDLNQTEDKCSSDDD